PHPALIEKPALRRRGEQPTKHPRGKNSENQPWDAKVVPRNSIYRGTLSYFADQGPSIIEPPGKEILLLKPISGNGMVGNRSRLVTQSFPGGNHPASKLGVLIGAWNIFVRAGSEISAKLAIFFKHGFSVCHVCSIGGAV